MSQQSIIGQSTVIRGNVSGSGSLEIQGRVEGDVSMTGDVIIQPGALVKGNVSGNQLSIAGSVAGSLTASDALALEPGARVIGDLVANSIGIAEGALVRGLVRTADETPLEAAKSAAAPAAKPSAMLQRPSVGSMPRPAATAIGARPAPLGFAPRAAALPVASPKPPPQAVMVEPAVLQSESDDMEDQESRPTSSSPELGSAADAALAPEQRGDGPPPPVAPALKKSQKAKKRGH